MKKIIIGGGIIVVALVCWFLYYAFSPLFISVHLDEEAPEVLVEGMESPNVQQPVPLVGTPGHSVSGTVQVIESGDSRVLRYENFTTTNGPDLFVYLSTDLQATEFVNLGDLKATEGNINYDIPTSVDLEKYRYALVWCKQFGVLFNSADLSLAGSR